MRHRRSERELGRPQSGSASQIQPRIVASHIRDRATQALGTDAWPDPAAAQVRLKRRQEFTEQGRKRQDISRPREWRLIYDGQSRPRSKVFVVVPRHQRGPECPDRRWQSRPPHRPEMAMRGKERGTRRQILPPLLRQPGPCHRRCGPFGGQQRRDPAALRSRRDAGSVALIRRGTVLVLGVAAPPHPCLVLRVAVTGHCPGARLPVAQIPRSV
jgi:hypothetical protein